MDALRLLFLSVLCGWGEKKDVPPPPPLPSSSGEVQKSVRSPFPFLILKWLRPCQDKDCRSFLPLSFPFLAIGGISVLSPLHSLSLEKKLQPFLFFPLRIWWRICSFFSRASPTGRTGEEVKPDGLFPSPSFSSLPFSFSAT